MHSCNCHAIHPHVSGVYVVQSLRQSNLSLPVCTSIQNPEPKPETGDQHRRPSGEGGGGWPCALFAFAKLLTLVARSPAVCQLGSSYSHVDCSYSYCQLTAVTVTSPGVVQFTVTPWAVVSYESIFDSYNFRPIFKPSPSPLSRSPNPFRTKPSEVVQLTNSKGEESGYLKGGGIRGRRRSIGWNLRGKF